MKKHLEPKAVLQQNETWKYKNNNSSRRFTIATGASPHLDGFEEMARNIALKRTDKSYSYNISRSFSADNDCHIQKLKFSVQHESPYHEQEIISNVKANDIKNNKSPREKRRSSIVMGRKPSLTVPVDTREAYSTDDKKRLGSTHTSRYQHFSKRLKSPTADRRKSMKDGACSDNSSKNHNKTHSVLRKHSKEHKDSEHIKNGTCDHNGITANVRTGSESSKSELKQTNENRIKPSLKMINSDSKISSDSESSSMVDNDTSFDGNSTDSTGTQLSPAALDANCSRRPRSEVNSVSPVRSRVSSGSRKSSLSQRSELSVTSTASNGSLADKIIELRALKMREILRDREAGSLESQDFLPPHFSCRRCSVNSDRSRGEESLEMFQKGFRSAASYPILNSDDNDQVKSENSMEVCQGTLNGVKKHLPDELPKDGENSVPIRLYKRKHIRRVLEA